MTLPVDAALLCYDGSSPSGEAIRRAGVILGPRPALVFHAWEAPTVHDRRCEAVSAQEERRLREAEVSASAVATAGAELARSAGFDAEPLLVQAHPRVADAILEAIETHRPGVVVMGSRGLSDIASALLGSVSTSVVHESERPVLVVPPDPSAEA